MLNSIFVVLFLDLLIFDNEVRSLANSHEPLLRLKPNSVLMLLQSIRPSESLAFSQFIVDLSYVSSF